jgi:hypothetical protein
MLARGTEDKERAMAEALRHSIAFVGIDIGKNSFHVVGLEEHGAIVLRQKCSRSQMEARFESGEQLGLGIDNMAVLASVRRVAVAARGLSDQGVLG